MDFVEKKRLLLVVGTTVMTAVGLTLGSAALADRADAAGCKTTQAAAKSPTQCGLFTPAA